MADEVANLTVEILKQIGDEVRSSNERLSRLETTMEAGFKDLRGEVQHTNQRLDRTNERLDETNDRLASLERAVVSMAKVNDAVLEEQLKDGQRLEGIEIRLRRLEAHVGLPPLR